MFRRPLWRAGDAMKRPDAREAKLRVGEDWREVLRARTVSEWSQIYSIPAGTIRDAIRRREIAVIVTGGGRFRRRVVILVSDFESWLERRRVPTEWEKAEARKGLRVVQRDGAQ